jgi:glycosyltransferase involved in cell wall biosynthesis
LWPSEWYENAPLAVLEANAMGKPVIGSDIAGIPELIRRGETGELFTPGDVNALAECLQRMASKPAAELRAMGLASRRWIEQEFSSGRYMERMQTLYAQIDAPATGIR